MSCCRLQMYQILIRPKRSALEEAYTFYYCLLHDRSIIVHGQSKLFKATSIVIPLCKQGWSSCLIFTFTYENHKPRVSAICKLAVFAISLSVCASLFHCICRSFPHHDYIVQCTCVSVCVLSFFSLSRFQTTERLILANYEQAILNIAHISAAMHFNGNT